MRKEANLLIFTLGIEMLNNVFAKLKENAQVRPADISIFRIHEEAMYNEGYSLILESKQFPVVKTGERVVEGIIEFEDNVLTFKQK